MELRPRIRISIEPEHVVTPDGRKFLSVLAHPSKKTLETKIRVARPISRHRAVKRPGLYRNRIVRSSENGRRLSRACEIAMGSIRGSRFAEQRTRAGHSSEAQH